MTEEQIREMVEDVEDNAYASRRCRGWAVGASNAVPLTWLIRREFEGNYIRVMGTALTIVDAIHAAIAMIDRLEIVLEVEA